MHIKTKSWRVPYSGKLLQYIRKGALSRQEGGFTLYQNASHPSLKGISQDFDQMMERIGENKRLKVYMHHHTLNFSPDDNGKLNTQVLEEMTRKYIDLRGFDKTLCFAQVHKGRNGGYHVHIMAANSILGPQTKSMRIDLYRYKAIQREMEQFQLERFNLTNSIVYLKKPFETKRDIEKEDRNRRQENEYHARKRKNKKELIKDKVLNILERLFEESYTYDDFVDNIMHIEGMTLHLRSQQTHGVKYWGNGKEYKFRFKTLGFLERFEELDRNEAREVQKLRMERLKEMQNKKTKENKRYKGR